MKKTYTVALAALTVFLCLPLFTSTSVAITGNYKPDTTPYVGAIVMFSDTARTHPTGYCTGFLIAPTVMVTTGHSLVGTQAVSVCFDKGPITFNIEEDGTITYDGAETIYTGSPETYPEYIPSLAGNQEFDTSDIGLIILDTPVEGITEFAALPQATFTDSLKSKTDLQIVGYGAQFQTTPRNNNSPSSWTDLIAQNSATAELKKSNFDGSDKYLKLTANSAQDKGGISFGDSGGPVIYTTAQGQNIIIAVNAFVSSVNCGGVSYHTRLDTPQVLSWLSAYIS